MKKIALCLLMAFVQGFPVSGSLRAEEARTAAAKIQAEVAKKSDKADDAAKKAEAQKAAEKAKKNLR